MIKSEVAGTATIVEPVCTLSHEPGWAWGGAEHVQSLARVGSAEKPAGLDWESFIEKSKDKYTSYF